MGGLAEVACRFFIFFKCGKFTYERNFEYDKDKVYRLKKNHSGIFAKKPFRTNSSGYRDCEIAVKKPKNTIRILVVGDSIAFGHGVLDHETFPEQLEAALNDNAKAYHFDVINTAVPGNSPFQEYYDLKRGLKFEPDIVIIQFALNDVIEPYWTYRRYGGRGTDYHHVEDISAEYLAYLNDFLREHSMFYFCLREVLARIQFRAIRSEDMAKKAEERQVYSCRNLVYNPDNPKIQEAWCECLKWMQKEVDLCQERGLDCILLISPFRFQLTLADSITHPQKILKEFALKNNIKCIDILNLLKDEIGRKIIKKYSPGNDREYIELFPEFGKEVKKTGYDYFLDYDHYSGQGHAFIAKCIYPVLQDILKEKGFEEQKDKLE